ncbi:HEXXH motif domain-containing protein [Actinomadura sp. 7K534]|uniref:HEXXH motif domain-containing protein n=1 Tax=Actinomadura sp. 7K534 TaxID=2530366 RepID=UPI00105151B3|nr:HEXXH motif domain-containing protein [Actinomadura sp. 7K534]TDB91987.1 HEXXH motif domain-containing protein [Actinomadura sp. 7K534]
MSVPYHDRPYHELSEESLMLLATGGSTPPILRELVLAQRSKQAALLGGVERLARSTAHPETELTTRALGRLLALRRVHPDVVEDVVSSPAVAAWSLQTVRDLHAGDAAARPGQMAALAAAVAARTGWPCRLDVPTFHGRVVLPTVGSTARPEREQLARFTVQSGRAVIDVGEQRIVIPREPVDDGSGWQAIRPISLNGTTFLFDDLHPTRMPGEELTDRVCAEAMRDWRTAMSDAWGLLTAHHPLRADEVRALIGTLTPLRSPPSATRSASSRETFGCVAMSFSTDARTNALALTHEVQHVKLGAILDVTRLAGPDRGRRYYAPWRDDPRPVEGLLQGSYAFMGVSDFWRRQRALDGGDADRAHFEFARWRQAAESAAATLLDSGELNPAGRIFVSVMLKTLEGWAAEPVPAGPAAAARRAAARHRRAWHARNAEFA